MFILKFKLIFFLSLKFWKVISFYYFYFYSFYYNPCEITLSNCEIDFINSESVMINCEHAISFHIEVLRGKYRQ